MAGAYAGTVVAVEVFVEGNEIAPVRISLEFCCTAKDCPSLIAVFQKDA
jgi:hypothetical protein